MASSSDRPENHHRGNDRPEDDHPEDDRPGNDRLENDRPEPESDRLGNDRWRQIENLLPEFQELVNQARERHEQFKATFF
jgi:hypothetical protein